MRLSLDVIRARKGDCLILHYGTRKKPRMILIDGGPSKVFAPHLKPRLEAIHKARGLGNQDALPVEVLMVSHVDDDHIKGILDLTRKLREQKGRQEPLLVRVASLWHNSFDDFVNTTPDELKAHVQFGEAALSDAGTIPSGDDFDTAKVLASIPQGRTLRLDAAFLEWRRNREFDGKLILARKRAKPIKLDGGLELSVIGPQLPELAALQKAHDKWLKAQERRRKKDPQAALAAFVDRSVPNLSSLVVLARAGGRSVLLTGDARGDKILEGLALKGLLGRGSKRRLHVDVLKVPHHGSANNVTTRFFERVTADQYLLSGNGEHGNPERETIEMIFAARGQAPFDLHFTYPIDEIDTLRKQDWKKEQAKEKKRNKGKVRPNWSQAKHGLKEFFAKHKLASGQRIHVVPDRQSHVIDLLDPTGL